MGKLIVIIGNVGAGKTTFAQQLCAALGYRLALEDHASRPFHHAAAAHEPGAGLANQVDFLLHRAAQEQQIRAAAGVGVMDGGLEQDYWIFTRFFAARGLLTPDEAALCARLYQLARVALPVPDLAIVLSAPPAILAQRYARRARPVEVVQPGDLPLLQRFVAEWRAQATCPCLDLSATDDDPGFARTIAALGPTIATRIGA